MITSATKKLLIKLLKNEIAESLAELKKETELLKNKLDIAYQRIFELESPPIPTADYFGNPIKKDDE